MKAMQNLEDLEKALDEVDVVFASLSDHLIDKLRQLLKLWLIRMLNV